MKVENVAYKSSSLIYAQTIFFRDLTSNNIILNFIEKINEFYLSNYSHGDIR